MDKTEGWFLAIGATYVAGMFLLYGTKQASEELFPSQEIPFAQVDTTNHYTIPLKNSTIEVPKEDLSHLELTLKDTLVVNQLADDTYSFSKK